MKRVVLLSLLLAGCAGHNPGTTGRELATLPSPCPEMDTLIDAPQAPHLQTDAYRARPQFRILYVGPERCQPFGGEF